MLRLLSSCAMSRSGISHIPSRIGRRSASRAAAAALFASAARGPQDALSCHFRRRLGDRLGDRFRGFSNYCRKNNGLHLMHGGQDTATRLDACSRTASKIYRQGSTPNAKPIWRRAMLLYQKAWDVYLARTGRTGDEVHGRPGSERV
jgi:hypothetical protein